MKRTYKRRTEAFTWSTKQELYDYFEQMHKLDRDQIDEEIAVVSKSFRVRQGRPINPQELWEKVGRSLESGLGTQKV
jgi:Asp-tRNA(Asn)/Glu-tRNA(Gln) amidotransferase C subunit